MIRYLFSLGFILIASWSAAQQTVGLFYNDSESFEGYTLFSPDYYYSTYLIDNCGNLVNEWTSDYTPGLSSYLLEDGSLLRCGRTNNSTFSAGGTGGIIERKNWDDQIIWSFEFSDENKHQHHDVEFLPNGNILILAWERIPFSEVVQSGRNPNTISDEFWSEMIVEIEPQGNLGGTVVWEWHAWDHLIQDFDNLRDNYGQIIDHPELLDVNFVVPNAPGPGNGLTDWLHCNSIDYNQDLDQILITCHNFSEIWIIDHSTTTIEAQGHNGGIYGKGGDIIYRWGNPKTYDRGNSFNQKLYFPHDGHWIKEGLQDENKIMIFNNGVGRSLESFSSVDVIAPPIEPNGSYTTPIENAFGPFDLYWSYIAPNPTDFYSPSVSSAQRLPNSNTLICEGMHGRIFEVDMEGFIHWEYINPVSSTGPVSQGITPVINNVFRASRLSVDYPGFVGHELISTIPIELNPITECSIQTGLDGSINEFVQNDLLIWVYENVVNIRNTTQSFLNLRLFDSTGKKIIEKEITGSYEQLEISNLNQGVYLLDVFIKNNQHSQTKKIMKL